MIVIGDLSYSQESLAELNRISQVGGTVSHASCENITATINQAMPLWKQAIDIDCPDIKNIRVYEYDYADRKLFALFNTSKQEQAISIRSDQYLTQWDHETGNCTARKGNLRSVIGPESIKYFSVSPLLFAKECASDYENYVPIDAQWSIHTKNLNTARLSNVQFWHENSGWLDPERIDSEANISALFIPSAFKGQTSIKMRGEFYSDNVPLKLGVVYEQMHFADLSINEQKVELKYSQPFAGWDTSCKYAEIVNFCRTGSNIVEGVLQFEKFETTLFSHGFFTERAVMPTCDVCLAGSIKLIDGKLMQHVDEEIKLPVDLAESGWPHYSGKVSFTCMVDVAQTLSKKIRGLMVTLISEDAVELILDGNSIGQSITYPYKFEFDSIMAGRHRLELVILTTSGNILDKPSPCGLLKAEWLC